MTITLSLTPQQQESLTRLSGACGIDSDTFLLDIVSKALADLNRSGARPAEPVPSGAIRISEELAARLPERFWLGAE
jgi:hypothetical protein